MMVPAMIAVLLVVGLAFVVVGAVFHAVLWLLFVGAALFVGTAVYGVLRRRRGRSATR